MTASTKLSHMTEEEKRDWDLAQKATEGPWSDSWHNEHGAGCTGAETADLCFISFYSPLPIVASPNAIKQSDNPEHWYGKAIARTAKADDAAFIAAARTGYPAALENLSAARAEKQAAEHERDREHARAERGNGMILKLESHLRDLREKIEHAAALYDDLADREGSQADKTAARELRAALKEESNG